MRCFDLLQQGVGIGYATAEKVELSAGRYATIFYDKASAVQLLASNTGWSLDNARANSLAGSSE